jgi:hypothetical protein
MFTCPVCYYDGLAEPPREYNICDCCGTEFGSDDELRTHAQLRTEWVARGARWFFRNPPIMWNPWQQLANANAPLPYVTNIMYSGPILYEPYPVLGVTTMNIIHPPAYSPYGDVSLISTSVSNSFADVSPTLVEGEFAEDVMGMAA